MKSFSKLNKFNIPSLLLFLTGTVIWSLTMLKSGLVYSYGMGFWGPNGHDGVWHLALAESLAKGSWQMPIFAQDVIKNYHIGFDLILAFLYKITFIRPVNLYFQIIPPFLAIFTGYFVYMFVLLWTKAKRSAFWATFFTYFSGSFGWVVSALRGQGFSGESMFWSQQSLSSLINPPFALSLVLIFAGLTFLLKYLEDGNKNYGLVATVLFGVLVQIKVYGGILVVAALFFASLTYLITQKNLVLFKVFLGSLVLSLFLILPVIKFRDNTLIWKPFWFLETMMSDPSRLYWPRFAQAMINYKLGNVFIKEIMAYGVAFALFIIGNLGLRLLSIFYFIKQEKRRTDYRFIDTFILTIIILGIITPTFYVQSGTTWNTIQFFYYSLVFLGILAGIGFSKLFLKSSVIFRGGLILTIFILTYPTIVATLRNYLPSRPPAMISKDELSALEFLAKQPDGIVLTQLFNREASEKVANNPPRPLYLYESTAYVSAFSNKDVYLEDEVNLEITGFPWQKRKDKILGLLKSENTNDAGEFLKEYGISYLYLVKNYEDFGIFSSYVVKIFENDEVMIMKVGE